MRAAVIVLFALAGCAGREEIYSAGYTWKKDGGDRTALYRDIAECQRTTAGGSSAFGNEGRYMHCMEKLKGWRWSPID